MSCGELFLKGASTIFSGYFLLVSIAFMAYGLTNTYFIIKVNSLETLDKELVSVPSLCLILFGCLLFIFIILGCCALCREVPACLEAYSIFLALLATAQIGVGVFCLVQFSIENVAFQERISEDVKKMFLDYRLDSKQLDKTQQWMQCCGVTDAGPNDWLRLNLTIPSTCCEGTIPSCQIDSAELYQEGCSRSLFIYIIGTNYIIGLILIVVAVTEVIGSLMGIALSCAFWRNSRIMWI